MSALLPDNYSWVVLGLFSTIVANVYLQLIVIKARKKYGIKLPTLYATADHIGEKSLCKSQADVDAYNSAQRTHQQTCENINTVRICGVVNGLLFPRFAGICMGLYSIGRIVFGKGYSSGGPSGRKMGGIISHLGDIPLNLCCTLYTAAVLMGYASSDGLFDLFALFQ
jgi:glutathione S-transferase